MPRRIFMLSILLVCLPLVSRSVAQTPKMASNAQPLELLRGWEIQSSCDAQAMGDKVSQPGFVAVGWHKTTVPNTVVGTLVDDKTYPEPMVGTNLKNFPGMNYSNASF